MLDSLVSRLGYKAMVGLVLASALILTRSRKWRGILSLVLTGYLSGLYLASRNSAPQSGRRRLR